MTDSSSIGIAEPSMRSEVAGREYGVRPLKKSLLARLALGAGVLLTFAWVGVLLYALIVLLF